MPVFLVLVRRILKLLLFMIDCASPFGINATVLMSYHSGQCRGQDSASGALNQISFPLSCDASVALRVTVPLYVGVSWRVLISQPTVHGSTQQDQCKVPQKVMQLLRVEVRRWPSTCQPLIENQWSEPVKAIVWSSVGCLFCSLGVVLSE